MPSARTAVRYFLRNVRSESRKPEILNRLSLSLSRARFDKIDLAITVRGYGGDRSEFLAGAFLCC